MYVNITKFYFKEIYENWSFHAAVTVEFMSIRLQGVTPQNTGLFEP
jgi:hypothetical protein